MYTYIKKNGQNYIDLSQKMDPTIYNVGTTWEDYLNGKFVLLSDKQKAFHEEHPEATVEEVWNMFIPYHIRTLEEAKEEKIIEINEYDTSSAVNEFFINEESLWLDKTTRVSLAYTLQIKKEAGEETIDLWYGVKKYTLKIETAEDMLAQLEIYASQCYNVTATHKSNVVALTTIEDVDAYDYTTNYPAKLHFNDINNKQESEN